MNNLFRIVLIFEQIIQVIKTQITANESLTWEGPQLSWGAGLSAAVGWRDRLPLDLECLDAACCNQLRRSEVRKVAAEEEKEEIMRGEERERGGEIHDALYMYLVAGNSANFLR